MRRKCTRYEGLMERYLTGEILPDERDDLEKHLSLCPDCSRVYRDISGVECALRTFPGKMVDPPPYLKTRILASIEGERKSLWAFLTRTVTAFAAILAIFLIMAVYGYLTRPSSPPSPPVAGEKAETGTKEVKIFFYFPDARTVSITGDFTNWDPKGLPMKKTGKKGLWEIDLKVKPGVYSYNFIIDGRLLVPDPQAPEQTPDGFGGMNSILLVPKGDVS
ncbi:MAG: hypothetical protein D6713_10880 [Deltaproteobacteria bacterium]|nr:MAG: hypothetical protein D6713_10880 [Deltaproteobacteria bacterium]